MSNCVCGMCQYPTDLGYKCLFMYPLNEALVHVTPFKTPAVSRTLITFTCIQDRCTVIAHSAAEDYKSQTAALQFASGSENAVHPYDWQ